MSNVHDHLWDDILQHVCDERRIGIPKKRVWKYTLLDLRWVCRWGSLMMIKLLFPGNCVYDNSGTTALHIASYFCRADLVHMLLETGANVNCENHLGWTPLHNAVHGKYKFYEHRYEIANMLLKGGANVNVRTKLGSTPLHICENDSMRELLIKAGGV